MPAPYVKFVRSDATDELMRFPNCFVLLAQIAQRARREVPTFNPFGLQVGEAQVGDHATIGLTRQEFRTALANLQKWSLITIRTTNKGTIAKLCNSDVYDINSETPNQQVTSQQPAANQPTTTNKNVKKERKKEVVVAPPPPAPLPAEKSKAEIAALLSAEVEQYTADRVPMLTDLRLFSIVLNRYDYGHVDAEFYRKQIQATMQAKNITAGVAQFESFIKRYMNLEAKNKEGLRLPKGAGLTANETPTNVAAGAITGSTIPSRNEMMRTDFNPRS